MTSRKTAALLSGAATAFCALALGGAPAWAENEDLPKESGQYSAVGDRSGPSEIQSDEALAGRVVEEATAFAGIPYRFGGTTARGMDCSFFVRTAFDAAGVLLP